MGSPVNIIFHYDAGPWLEGHLQALAADGLMVSTCGEADEARFLALLPATDVLWHVLKPLRADHILAAPRLRLIQKIGVGVNTIDLEAARARDIPVCNMPGTNSRAVAEMTLGLMLAVLRKLGALDRQLRNSGEWRSPPAWQGDLGELCGRTVGLVGFGAVPRLLAPILAAMGAEVVYTGRGAKVDVPYAYLAKEELLGKADIVSLHIPETEETYHWLDSDAMAAMKPGALLINTARGGLIEESALLGALQSGQLAGAGLDVFASEPLAEGHPLLALDNVIAAPHVAWLTRQTLERSLAFAVDNIRRLESGEPLRNQVA